MECIECGEKEGEFNSLCGDCFLKHNAIMESPEYVNITICPHCGALKRGEHWLRMEEPEMAVDLSVKEALTFGPEVSYADVGLEIAQENPLVYHARALAQLHVRGLMAEKETDVITRVEHRVCDVCSRLHGSYYESIVQLRGYDSKISPDEKVQWLEIAKSIVDELSGSNRQVFLSKSVEMHGGLDFYLSTTDAGRHLAKELLRRTGASLKESAKIAGKKDGRDLYRTTFGVRLPPFGKCDYILLDHELYRVEKVSKERVILLNLRSGDEVKMKRDIDSRARVLGGEEIILEAVVVFDGDGEVQLMDPVTYKTVPVRKPTHYEGDETVGVVRYEGELYIA